MPGLALGAGLCSQEAPGRLLAAWPRTPLPSVPCWLQMSVGASHIAAEMGAYIRQTQESKGQQITSLKQASVAAGGGAGSCGVQRAEVLQTVAKRSSVLPTKCGGCNHPTSKQVQALKAVR